LVFFTTNGGGGGAITSQAARLIKMSVVNKRIQNFLVIEIISLLIG